MHRNNLPNHAPIPHNLLLSFLLPEDPKLRFSQYVPKLAIGDRYNIPLEGPIASNNP